MTLSKQMYKTMPGSPASKLAETYHAGISPVIILADGNAVPDAPNIVTILSADRKQFSTVRYGSKNGDILSSLEVLYGEDRIYDAGLCIAVRNYSHIDDEGIKTNIEDTERRVTALEQEGGITAIKINGEELPRDASGAVLIPTAAEDVLGVVKSGTEAIIKQDGSIDVSAVSSKMVTDVMLNSSSVVSDGVAFIDTIDNVTSAGNQQPLSANQGKILNDRINNLASIGRFLSLWNCATGLPATDPAEIPYEYKAGDYYIISEISETGDVNYQPSGTTYTGAASTVEIEGDISDGDIFRFDGTHWIFDITHPQDVGVLDVTVDGVDVVSAGVANIPAADANNTGALTAEDWTRFDGKQNKITVSTREPTEDEGEVGDIWLVIEP